MIKPFLFKSLFEGHYASMNCFVKSLEQAMGELASLTDEFEHAHVKSSKFS